MEDRYEYSLIVFMSGFVSMGFEMVAGRLFEPIFGSSVFVWGSVIGSVLLGLGLGYYVGGKISREIKDRDGFITSVFLLLALIIILVGLFIDPLADILSITDGITESLVPSILTLGPVAFLFGTINPVVIEIIEGHKGETSGTIFFASTFGGIFGTFIATFYLIPFQGLTSTVFLFCALLLVISSYLIFIKNVNEHVSYIIVVLLIGITVLSGIPLENNPQGTIHSEEGLNKNIKIIEHTENNNVIRKMTFDNPNTIQSAVYKNNTDRIYLEYTGYTLIPLFDKQKIDNSLIIGGGGYKIPRLIHNISNSTIKVIEKDRVVYELAQEYMYYSEEKYPRINTSIADGREYIENSNKTYDYILLDAYGAENIPTHMTTVEYYNQVKNTLDEDGYLVVNIADNGRFFRSQYKTMKSVFPNYNSYTFRTTPSTNNNIIILTNRNLSEERINENSRSSPHNLTEVFDNRYKDIEVSTVPIITDDKNPSDIFIGY